VSYFSFLIVIIKVLLFLFLFLLRFVVQFWGILFRGLYDGINFLPDPGQLIILCQPLLGLRSTNAVVKKEKEKIKF
jgi:hypothetical protein